jgi:hypothetical protein
MEVRAVVVVAVLTRWILRVGLREADQAPEADTAHHGNAVWKHH